MVEDEDTTHRYKTVDISVSIVDPDPDAYQTHDLWGGSKWQHPGGRITINPDKVCRELRAVMIKNGYMEVN